jgi:hypothetical protein
VETGFTQEEVDTGIEGRNCRNLWPKSKSVLEAPSEGQGQEAAPMSAGRPRSKETKLPSFPNAEVLFLPPSKSAVPKADPPKAAQQRQVGACVGSFPFVLTDSFATGKRQRFLRARPCLRSGMRRKREFLHNSPLIVDLCQGVL